MANAKVVEIDQVNGDHISRKALLDALDTICAYYSAMEERTAAEAIKDCIQFVKEAPAVEAEPKHGWWIPLEYDGYADGNPVWDLWECSECQEEHSGDEDTLTPYCPICGTIMDLEVNDNGKSIRI